MLVRGVAPPEYERNLDDVESGIGFPLGLETGAFHREEVPEVTRHRNHR